MTIIDDGLVGWASFIPGPNNKIYAATNEGRGIVCHSMEGSYDGSYRELMNPSRQASWMFSLRTDGRLVQHYRVTASPWASGNALANTTLWSVEAEGKAGEPLTGAQEEAMMRLCREWENWKGRLDAPAVASRLGVERTVWQHNEVWSWETPNAGPTACPSGRYDNFFAALQARNDAVDATPPPVPDPLATMNTALQERFALMRLALDADHLRVAAAVGTLKTAGYLL